MMDQDPVLMEVELPTGAMKDIDSYQKGNAVS